MFDLFKDENVAAGLQPNAQFKAGVSDFDPAGVPVESGINLPWNSDADATWVYYDVALATVLDSGVVTHRHLPQSYAVPATLASCVISDPNIDKITGRGVNIIPTETFADIVQRMAHAQYWFRLFGQAMRVGNQVPIPGLRSVGGVPAIPHDANPQSAYNKIVGNYSGVPLWYATWSLWYTVAVPPRGQQVPPPNLAAHIGGNGPVPTQIQAPFSQPDDEAMDNNPILQKPIQG